MLKAEDNPPIRADGDAPISSKVASERVKPETGQIELLGSGGFIEPREYAGDFVRMLRVDFTAVVVFVKASQAAMSKASESSRFVR